jgi:hypothetical protein
LLCVAPASAGGDCQRDRQRFAPFSGSIAPILSPINGFHTGNPRFGSSSVIRHPQIVKFRAKPIFAMVQILTFRASFGAIHTQQSETLMHHSNKVIQK